jgi:hypothetical protein
VNIGYASSRLGAGQRRWVVFFGGIYAQGGGAAQGPDRCRDR